MNKNYQIYLSTPLGIKKGTMSFLELKGKINGYLNVMNNKNKFSGFLLADGQINLEGVIKTLINVMHYRACGTISGSNILLNLKMDSTSCYSLSGEEIFVDEEVL